MREYGPSTFERLAQGSTAREANIVNARERTAFAVLETVPSKLTPEPGGGNRLLGFAPLLVPVGLALSLACSPDAKAVDVISTQPEARATATAIAVGGDVKFSDPEFNNLFDKIQKGQATEEDILKFNAGIESQKQSAEATAEAAKKTESFLSEYSVWFGTAKKEDGTGTVIAANLPNYPGYLYVAEVIKRRVYAGLYEIQKIDGSSLEAVAVFTRNGALATPTSDEAEAIRKLKSKEGYVESKMSMTLNNDGTLTGGYAKGSVGERASSKYDMTGKGKGKEVFMEWLKKLWAIEILNDPASWQNVNEAAISPLRGIEVPE